ncbi:Basic membrane protein B [Actinoplanes sp. SE50]|uniref:BMP family lipoprotein n=1 Tax=unclassified Actinoplanes TaxID=2626549 RepID=UPI00023EC29D|nr:MULTISPECIES: BMP family ABC transporter substrate-binding protein [unclassified Actinoplanes]AEV84605.1 Basic membrane protein B [Actinoplanes sp. SE50/110]ATO82997.1 Basic membrane protein B [Actinoplanes sp. SE50]SLM00405.1 Basic membrane protein B [Actinoplanes sp. SE50/110]
MSKRTATGLLGAALTLLLSACSAAMVPVAPADSSGLGRQSVHVGIAYDSAGRGDKSFNDAAAAGVDRAKQELLVEASEAKTQAESDDARAAALRGLAAGGSNPVIAVGFLYAAAVGKVAKEFPGTLFAIIDDDSVTADNVVALLFSEEQGSYLVGVAAGLATKRHRVGFVGGVDVPLIHKFAAGYVAGVHSVSPDVQVDVRYLTKPPDFGGFSAPAKGKAAAQQMIAGGADVIYAAAGGSGTGVFEAATAAPGHVWTIGVDSDQYATAAEAVRPHILTSMLKRVDNGVFQEIQAFVKGDRAGGRKRYDLKVDGVGYATSNKALGPYVPGMEKARYRILSGAVRVPVS